MKKIFASILVFCIFCTAVFSVYAFNEDLEAKKFNNHYIDLKFSDLKSYADSELQSFLMGSKEKNISIDYDAIPLYSVSSERYAFFLPLKTGNNIVGYMVLGALNGSYHMYECTISDGDLAQMIVKESKKNSIAYKFPSGFLVNENGKYYLIDNNLNKVNAAKNKAFFSTKLPSVLRNAKCNSTAALRSSYESVQLSDYYDFVEVYEGSTTYYGGDQDWLHEKNYISEFWANRSCGVTAASNVAHYYSKNKSGKGNLYQESSLHIDKFTKHMNDVYEYLTPAVWGIPGIDTMITRFERFADSRGVELNGVRDSSSWTLDNVSDYIKRGLSNDCPVMMITWNTSIPELKYHWVTITRYYKSPTGRKVYVSNWGNKKSYSLDAWYEDFDSSYKGVIYFE